MPPLHGQQRVDRVALVAESMSASLIAIARRGGIKRSKLARVRWARTTRL
jgi:hypothetical protein